MNMTLRSTLVWFCMLVLAFINGALREIIMKSFFGLEEPLANQLSCLSGVFLLSTFMFIFWKYLRVRKLSQSCTIGLYWFLATMIFETFILNRKLSWADILQTYNVFEGQYWALVLLWIGVMPVVIFLAKKNKLN